MKQFYEHQILNGLVKKPRNLVLGEERETHNAHFS